MAGGAVVGVGVGSGGVVGVGVGVAAGAQEVGSRTTRMRELQATMRLL